MLESMVSGALLGDDGESPTHYEMRDTMITIVWIALATAVLGSIELVARAATGRRSAVKVGARNLRTRHR